MAKVVQNFQQLYLTCETRLCPPGSYARSFTYMHLLQSHCLQSAMFLLSFYIIYFYPVGEVWQFIMEPVDQQPEVSKLEIIIHNGLNSTDV